MPPLESACFHKPFVIAHDQMRLDLRNSINGHTDNNEQGRTAEIKGNIKLMNKQSRHDADSTQINRADHGQPGQHLVDKFRGPFAGADTGDKTTILL